ncbi:unnamed protein product [Nesidiocoris tenuis]|uniref:Uncharacterized protein n=1 Tax=Nesidiocoris tenuis TaxID=355587 RepID=A0A6H5G115_9HEMI|nr:unnamed protein product [Nesidiocoris tenuis]
MALVALNDHESTPDFEEVMKKSLEAEARGEEIGDEYTLVGNMSPTAEKRGDIPFDVFQKYMATKNGGENQFVCDGLKKLVKKCQEWGDEWLLDFQVGFICTPARDLHMFLTTSVRMEVRDKHLNTLIQAYADSLQSVLTKCNYTGEIPNADGVYKMLEKTEIFHFADSFSMALVALNDHESAPDYEEIVKHRREASEKGEELGEEYSLVRNMSPRATNIIQVAIKQAMKSGVI